MAQGCHLIYSNADKEHFPIEEVISQSMVEEIAGRFQIAFNLPWKDIISQNIVKEDGVGVQVDREEAAKHSIKGTTFETFEKRFGKYAPGDKAFVTGLLSARGDRQVDILTGLGNPHLEDEMAAALPQALNRILKQDPGATGLFDCARAGASSWISHLKNEGRGKADGIAYEALATAKVIHSGVGSLKIGSTDELDFGRKSQASYGKKSKLTVTDGWVKESFCQPRRKTVEADLLIKRPVSPAGDWKEIAVDFKHYTSGPVKIASEQLEGIRIALKTGEVQEWHFITNAPEFSRNVVDEVNKINEELKKSGDLPVQLHTNYDWR